MSRSILLSGIVWTLIEQLSVQILQFIISVNLARLLTPADFGLLGMVVVVTAISSVFVVSGLTTSLIRTPDIDEEDLNTVFWYNIIVSIIFMLLLLMTAPLIADFYGVSELTAIVRFMSIGLFLSAIAAVQIALLSREMKFKKLALIQVPSTLLSGLIAIFCAYKGMGVWSLVIYSLSSSAFKGILLFVSSTWRPTFVFNNSKFKRHIAFGLPLLGSGLLDTIFREGNKLFVGKVFSTSDLGHYVRAETFKNLPVSNISTTLSKVMFPYLSKKQDDVSSLTDTYRRLMSVILFLLIPSLLILAFLSKEVFIFLFGPQWGLASELFPFLAIAGIFYPLIAQNNNLIGVLGRSDIVFKSEAVRKILFLFSFLIAYLFGLKAFVLSQIGVNIVSWVVAAYFSGRVAKYGVGRQVKDYSIYFAIGTIVLTLMYILKYFEPFALGIIWSIITYSLIFMVIYLLISKMAHLQAFQILVKFGKQQFKRA